MVTLEINRKNYEVDVESETPLLWALRDHLKLHGTKYGCGIERPAADRYYCCFPAKYQHVNFQ